MNVESTYLTVVLPVLLLYLLAILRLLERRQMPLEQRVSTWSFLSIRDAALVTLALDVSVIAQGFLPFFLRDGRFLTLAVAVTLFLLHLTVFLLAVVHRPSKLTDDGHSASYTRGLLDAYLALILLATNAVTMIEMMEALGRVK